MLNTKAGTPTSSTPSSTSYFKVCLSILNTWHGRPEERWNPNTSNLLQVIKGRMTLQDDYTWFCLFALNCNLFARTIIFQFWIALACSCNWICNFPWIKSVIKCKSVYWASSSGLFIFWFGKIFNTRFIPPPTGARIHPVVDPSIRSLLQWTRLRTTEGYTPGESWVKPGLGV